MTQLNDTEHAFSNTYWDNHEAGLYVDVATGEPLFSSKDKLLLGWVFPSRAELARLKILFIGQGTSSSEQP